MRFFCGERAGVAMVEMKRFLVVLGEPSELSCCWEEWCREEEGWGEGVRLEARCAMRFDLRGE
jgi:hypothetical protein